MSWLGRYLRSSIGAKHVMAVSGVMLLLFAIVHMLGHLQMFGGAAMYNAYARFLQELWEVKWPVRVGLLGLLAVHVVTALALVARNRAARPVGYAVYRPVVSSKVLPQMPASMSGASGFQSTVQNERSLQPCAGGVTRMASALAAPAWMRFVTLYSWTTIVPTAFASTCVPFNQICAR